MVSDEYFLVQVRVCVLAVVKWVNLHPKQTLKEVFKPNGKRSLSSG